jgi:hypothetical protein
MRGVAGQGRAGLVAGVSVIGMAVALVFLLAGGAAGAASTAEVAVAQVAGGASYGAGPPVTEAPQEPAAPLAAPAAPVARSATPPEPEPVAEASAPEPDRSTFATGVATELDLSPASVATSAGLGMLLLLAVLAAAQLFNDAMKHHHDELVAQLGDRSTVLGRGRLLAAALPHPPVVLTFAAVAAVLGLLADPTITFSLNTLAQVSGMVFAIGAIALIYDGVAWRLIGHDTGTRGTFRLYPMAIAVAVLCLLVSRFLGVAPGVLYGLFIGVAFAGIVESKLVGRAYAASSVLVLVAAMLAFLVHRIVAPTAEGADPGFWAIAIDTAAAVLVVGGMQAVIVQLLPTRYVNGENIWRWSRLGWLGLIFGAMTLYVMVVVRPNPDQQSWGSLWFVVALVVGAVLFWLWAYFHGRTAAGAPPTETAPDDGELVSQ